MRLLAPRLPPGLPPVLRFLAVQLAPLAAALVAARLLQAYGVLYIPTVMLVVGAVLSIPLLVVARIVYAKYDLKRRAARLGAVLPPSRVGKSIGNIDILKHGIERWKNGYVGT